MFFGGWWNYLSILLLAQYMQSGAFIKRLNMIWYGIQCVRRSIDSSLLRWRRGKLISVCVACGVCTTSKIDIGIVILHRKVLYLYIILFNYCIAQITPIDYGDCIQNIWIQQITSESSLGHIYNIQWSIQFKSKPWRGILSNCLHCDRRSWLQHLP